MHDFSWSPDSKQISYIEHKGPDMNPAGFYGAKTCIASLLGAKSNAVIKFPGPIGQVEWEIPASNSSQASCRHASQLPCRCTGLVLKIVHIYNGNPKTAVAPVFGKMDLSSLTAFNTIFAMSFS